MWNEIASRLLTALVLWSAGLLLVDAGIRVLRVRGARVRQLAMWTAYVSLVPGTLVSVWFRPGITLLPARPAAGLPGKLPAATPPDTLELLSALVLVALALGAMASLGAWLRLHRARRELTPCGDARVESLLAQLKHDLGIRQGVQLRTRAGGGSPFSVGWLRPLIVLPESIVRRADPTTLEHILTHELIHIRHADFVLNAMQKLTRSLAWFNPLAHIYDACLDQWREVACDTGVLERGTISRGDYARTLLTLGVEGGAPIASVALIRKHSNLKRRVSHMRITQTRDRLVKKVLLGSLAAIPFVLISCSNSDVNGPEATAPATNEAQAVVLREVPEGAVNFGELHTRDDGSREWTFRFQDGSEGTVEFAPDASVSDKELHFIRQLAETDDAGFGPAVDANPTDPGHNVFVEEIAEDR